MQRYPIQLEWVINQYFEIDHYQPLLFVVDSFDHLFDLVGELERWMRQGRLDNVSPGEPAISEPDLRSFLEASASQVRPRSRLDLSRPLASHCDPICGRNSVVECQLPKLDVAGSSPVARSSGFISVSAPLHTHAISFGSDNDGALLAPFWAGLGCRAAVSLSMPLCSLLVRFVLL